MILSYLLIMILLAYGAWLLCRVAVFNDCSFEGHRQLRSIAKLKSEQKDFWSSDIMKKLTGLAARFVYLDGDAEEQLARQLNRTGLDLTPKEFTARRYVILFGGAVGAALCALLQFWIGFVLCLLAAVFGMMRQRDALRSKVHEKDKAIAQEMPRFIRTICRNLRGNRDIYAAIQSYRKVTGPALGSELDILLAHMRSGNVQSALNQFQARLATEEANRLCSTLYEIDRGIDQSATLEYLADDMARQLRLNIQKQFSARPARMRRTYYPAVGVCVVMILYVLVVFVIAQLGTLI